MNENIFKLPTGWVETQIDSHFAPKMDASEYFVTMVNDFCFCVGVYSTSMIHVCSFGSGWTVPFVFDGLKSASYLSEFKVLRVECKSKEYFIPETLLNHTYHLREYFYRQLPCSLTEHE
jgi:hypothetical protein